MPIKTTRWKDECKKMLLIFSLNPRCIDIYSALYFYLCISMVVAQNCNHYLLPLLYNKSTNQRENPEIVIFAFFTRPFLFRLDVKKEYFGFLSSLDDPVIDCPE